MKPITVSRRSRFINQLLQQAREHNLILQSANGEQFVLAKIADAQDVSVNADIDVEAFTIGGSDDFEEEIALTRQNVALMHFLDERAAYVKPGSGTSLEEIRKRLGE
ncbi:MAG: hypothetical protein ACJ8CR_00205 [Roseiflexaceae bacterium]